MNEMKEGKASQMFELYRQVTMLEDDVFEEVFTVLGYPRDSEDERSEYPCSNWFYDEYDASFEWRGTRAKVTMTPEQRAALYDMGFLRCWIRYTDDVPGPFTNEEKREDYFHFGPMQLISREE